jgi:hypothetical protein
MLTDVALLAALLLGPLVLVGLVPKPRLRPRPRARGRHHRRTLVVAP